MVFGRRRTTAGKTRPVPPPEWLWSPEPTHPAIITRATWDAAQVIGAWHGSSRDGGEPNSHPATRRTYVLRGRIRCRACQHRMSGITRTSSRYYTDGPDTQYTYYACQHNPARPRPATAAGHPRTISVREEHLIEAIRQFYAERIFGPDRAALLAAQLPATAAQDTARRRKKPRASPRGSTRSTPPRTPTPARSKHSPASPATPPPSPPCEPGSSPGSPNSKPSEPPSAPS